MTTAIATPALPAKHSIAPAPALRYWLLLIASIFALKVVLLALDHAPKFFLGDSVSYLNTATGDWIPPDRSFIYGWLIRLFAVKSGSLTALLLAQTAASALCALLCAYILQHYFAASRALTAIIAILCALEPLQLLYERYMMTEAFSLLLFALFTTLTIGYLKQPSLISLIFVQLAGVMLVSLRVSYLPLILAATLLAPVLAAHATKATRPLLRRSMTVAIHLLLSCACFFALHSAYKHWYANLIQHELPGAPPAYYYDNGFHLLCFVAPLVEPADFPDPSKTDEVFRDLAFDLKDPQMRPFHRWWDGGLIAHVKGAYMNPLEANHIAETTARNAVGRNPLGELRLASHGYGLYWNIDGLKRGLLTDLGADRELPPDFLASLNDYFNLDAQRLPTLQTITYNWFYHAWTWYLLLLLLPIPLLMSLLVAHPEDRPAIILLLAFSSLTIIVIAACSILPTVRFLHPIAWLAMISLGILISLIPINKSANKELSKHQL